MTDIKTMNEKLNDAGISNAKRIKLSRLAMLAEKFNKNTRIVDSIIVFKPDIPDDFAICIVSDYDCSNTFFFNFFGNIENYISNACDIFIYNDLNADLKEEIDTNGIVIYKM